MVKATDVRLNNLLMENGQVCKVVSINPNVITVQYGDELAANRLPPEKFEGIDLTEDILLKSGFVESDDKKSYRLMLDEHVVITVNPHIAGCISVQLCVNDNWCGKPVRYMHDLQNIYHDLTGEELLIKFSYAWSALEKE